LSSRVGLWLGFGRAAARERAVLEGQLRELRLANATLRAEMSMLRLELDQARALAAERSSEMARLALLRRVVASPDLREKIHLGYSPDVKPLTKTAEVVDLSDAAAKAPAAASGGGDATEIVMPVRPSAVGAHRRTA